MKLHYKECTTICHPHTCSVDVPHCICLFCLLQAMQVFYTCSIWAIDNTYLLEIVLQISGETASIVFSGTVQGLWLVIETCVNGV